jgi:hypothetical protein
MSPWNENDDAGDKIDTANRKIIGTAVFKFYIVFSNFSIVLFSTSPD